MNPMESSVLHKDGSRGCIHDSAVHGLYGGSFLDGTPTLGLFYSVIIGSPMVSFTSTRRRNLVPVFG